MTTTPNGPGQDGEDSGSASTRGDDDSRGVEIGMSPDGEGSTFEPEEDPEGHG